MNFIKIVSILLLLSVLSCSEKVIEADILIINGLVYNGLDKMPEGTKIAIQSDKIVFVGKKEESYFKAKKMLKMRT